MILHSTHLHSVPIILTARWNTLLDAYCTSSSPLGLPFVFLQSSQHPPHFHETFPQPHYNLPLCSTPSPHHLQLPSTTSTFQPTHPTCPSARRPSRLEMASDLRKSRRSSRPDAKERRRRTPRPHQSTSRSSKRSKSPFRSRTFPRWRKRNPS